MCSAVAYSEAKAEGLLTLGLCNPAIEAFALQNVQQLMLLASAADWTRPMTQAEISQPNTRIVEKRCTGGVSFLSWHDLMV